MELVTRAPWGRLFWIIAEDYEGTHKEFEYALQWFTQLDAVDKRDISMPLRHQWHMRLKTGQVIETKTGSDISKIRSDAPDGILLVEAATVPYGLFLKCFGRLGETRGWLVASGTFEGSSGWYPELFREMQGPNQEYRGRSFSVPSWSNPAVYPGGREDPEIKRLERIYSRVPGLFDERCGGVPTPPVNLVFREYLESTHVVASEQYSYKPGVPVYLGVDPSDGGHPYAVIACQFFADHDPDPDDRIDFCVVIDEVWEQGLIDEQMIDACMRRVWWKDVRGGAIDKLAPDSRRRWLSYAGVQLASDRVEQLVGIRRLHSFLYSERAGVDDVASNEYIRQPHLLIVDQPERGASYGLRYEFPRYKRKETDVGSDMLPSEVPNPNLPCDAIKALWYLLVARYGAVRGRQLPKPVYTLRRGTERVEWRGKRTEQSLPRGGHGSEGRTFLTIVEKRVFNAEERRRTRRAIRRVKDEVFKP